METKHKHSWKVGELASPPHYSYDESGTPLRELICQSCGEVSFTLYSPDVNVNKRRKLWE